VSDILPVRRALISVADKSGLVEFGRGLAERGVALVSSGSTAAALQDGEVPVTPVSEVTGFPEMLEGRVKTLHPRIHAGILADKRKPEHMRSLGEHGIAPFDLVVVNLYPFREAVTAGVSFDEVIEQIDVGGPALVRAAAKNFQSVGVVVGPLAYPEILGEIDAEGGLTRHLRVRLAREAFGHTASYDAAIAAWFADQEPKGGEQGLPERLTLALVKLSELRYGENPHQRGALYVAEGSPDPLGGAEVLQGKEMSYNNWLDAEAARAAAALFELPTAVIVKHNNPCGVAMGRTLAEAYHRALEGDRLSAFGGVVAFNREVDEMAARAMAGVFTEVVVAPSYTKECLAAFVERPNLRVVRAPAPERGGLEIRPIDGGALVQDTDSIVEDRADMKVVTSTDPTDDQWDDLLFGWKVVARAKSNAIVLSSGGATVALGAGQMNRAIAVDLAARQAGLRAKGSCLASDAFFPFRDGIDRAAEGGVAAIIQPGGSVRDEEVIAAAEEHHIAMVFTGRRHFRH
jgi:phosphoribosylaminoimidazolecarboxamide formyltransferase/IMP cyclohydrolase